MATKNATLTTTDWQDVETITDIVLANGSSYTLTIRGGYNGEVCIAADTPANTLVGHPLHSNQNFNYTHTAGDKCFVKADAVGATFVIS